MKKICTLAVVLGVVMLLPATALAHGHGRRHAAQSQTYAVCPVEDCAYVDQHQHDGVTYCAHYAGDGHAYHNTANRCGGHGGCH